MSSETTLSHTVCEKDTTILCLIIILKRIVVIFAKQHQRSKEKLTVERRSPQLINVATLPCKMKHSPIDVTQQHQKGIKFHKKNRSLLVHIFELSTTVVKVDIKVITVSLTQSQCLQYVMRCRCRP